MMEWLDHFVDTKKKRYHLFFLILLVLTAILILPYVYIGIRLMLLDSYDALYGMLDDSILSLSYLSRLVLEVISIASFSIGKLIKVLLSCVRPVELLLLILLLIAMPILEKKKVTTFALLLLCVEMLITFLCVFLGLKATSLAQAIFYVRILGATLSFISLALLVLLGYHILRRLRYYTKALRYTCVEVTESETSVEMDENKDKKKVENSVS